MRQMSCTLLQTGYEGEDQGSDEICRPPISKECDFIIKRGIKLVSAIQVCWELNQRNQERGFRGPVEGMETLDIEEGVVLTYNDERKTEFKGRTISILPVWKLLLS